MSAARLLDELLSGFAPLAGDVHPDPTPAKAANPAIRQLPPGLAADSVPCEGARKLANHGPDEWLAATGSQAFAADRKSEHAQQSQQPCGLSQDSQNSQRLTGPMQPGPDLAATAWTDLDISRFLDRRARLLRWGWPEPEAENLAERLTLRDRVADQRVTCIECSNYKPGRCGNHRRAGLMVAEVGRDLAAMLQRCPGYQPVG